MKIYLEYNVSRSGWFGTGNSVPASGDSGSWYSTQIIRICSEHRSVTYTRELQIHRNVYNTRKGGYLKFSGISIYLETKSVVILTKLFVLCFVSDNLISSSLGRRSTQVKKSTSSLKPRAAKTIISVTPHIGLRPCKCVQFRKVHQRNCGWC